MANKTFNWQSIKSILIIVMVVSIILFFLFECHRDIQNGDIKAPKNAYKYKTTEVYKDSYFKLRDSLKNLKPIPPIIIEKWLSPSIAKIDSVSIIEGYLKLHPQGKEEVLVNSDFILNYPESPKLISLNLIKDSLSISLYSPDNLVKTSTYPLYLQNYGYRYINNQMEIYDIKAEPIALVKPKMRWDNLYLNAGYDIYSKSVTSGLEYNLSPGRFKFDLNLDVLMLQQPELNLTAKLGYRLFK